MIKKGWQQLRQQKKNGISMAVVLCVSAFFVAFAAAILYTAGMLTAQSNLRLKQEESGRLDLMLDSIASSLEDEAEQATKRIVTLLEPILIVFMAVIVGFIMIAVMLPIYQSYASIENS